MIPLRDKNPTRRFPVVTISLIVLNIVVFVRQLTMGEGTQDLFAAYAAIPADITAALKDGRWLSSPIRSIVTAMFLHGGWLHLGGNMLYLWVFGDNVEDKLGRIRYLLFYLLCGIAAAAGHVWFDPSSAIPMVGASGAISGVLGAYLIMFPRTRVVTLIPIFVFIQVAELPAIVVLGFWFLLQFLNGMISVSAHGGGMGGVAWWAHIGGFVAGLLLVLPFRKSR